VVDDEAADALAGTVAHFAPRFKVWWKETGAVMLQKVPAEFRELAQQHDLLGVTSDFATMLGSSPVTSGLCACIWLGGRSIRGTVLLRRRCMRTF